MAYFYANQNTIDRRGKIAADIFCGVLLLAFGVGLARPLVGVVGFIILYGALIGVDFVVPDEHADRGAVVR